MVYHVKTAHRSRIAKLTHDHCLGPKNVIHHSQQGSFNAVTFSVSWLEAPQKAVRLQVLQKKKTCLNTMCSTSILTKMVDRNRTVVFQAIRIKTDLLQQRLDKSTFKTLRRDGNWQDFSMISSTMGVISSKQSRRTRVGIRSRSQDYYGH